jgi:hypothetical protein
MATPQILEATVPMLFPIPLEWHNNELVWVEQFGKGHLEYSTSAWNTVFVIQKRAAGHWRLLQDSGK